MIINSIEVKLLSIPLAKAVTTNIHTFDKLNCLLTMITTTSGLTGQSFIHGLGKTLVGDIKTDIINVLYEQLRQKKLFIATQTWQNFWHAQRANKTTVEIYALAAIDIAIWDLLAKEQNKPLHQLLGAKHHKFPAYGTTGWLSLSQDELITECQKYASLGINGFKIRLGHAQDYERVKSVREAMGDDFKLMLDANQRYNVQNAIEIAQNTAKFNITWLEEPVGNSLNELQQITANSPIPIAVGENIFTRPGFAEVCQNHAAAFLQPDIIRCGGITGFLAIADLVRHYNLPLCNHLLPELSVSLLAAYPNSYLLEYDDLIPNHIFTQDFSIQDGCMRLPNIAGTGVALTDSAIACYSV